MTEAWSPLGRGGELFAHPPADRHGKSPAQIMLRRHVEQDVIPVARSSNPERIAQNIDVLDFALAAEELASLAVLDESRTSPGTDRSVRAARTRRQSPGTAVRNWSESMASAAQNGPYRCREHEATVAFVT